MYFHFPHRLGYNFLRRMANLHKLVANQELITGAIKSLKIEIAEIENLLKESRSSTSEKLKKENSYLEEQINKTKEDLIRLETARGIKQIAVPKLQSCKSPGDSIGNIIPEKLCQQENDAVENQIKSQSKKEPKKKESSKNESKKVENSIEGPVDVSRLDFRIGKIVDIKRHPDADSLYVEQVDIGSDKPITVVSGLVKHVPIGEMENRLVVLLCNLKPAKMRGITSEAMVMCASTPEKVEVLLPPPSAVPGDLVLVEGYSRIPDPVLNPKKKIFEIVAPDLTTDSQCQATYKGKPWSVSGKGVITTFSLRNVNIK